MILLRLYCGCLKRTYHLTKVALNAIVTNMSEEGTGFTCLALSANQPYIIVYILRDMRVCMCVFSVYRSIVFF